VQKSIRTPGLSSGFTLLELALVLFIISIVFGLALPSLSMLGEGKLKAEAKKLSSLLRYLNDSALSTKQVLSLKIDIGRKTISMSTPEGMREENTERLQSVTLPSRGTVTAGEVTYFFSPTGAQESIEFFLKDDKEGLKVSFRPMSGRVRIVKSDER
jgi:prepilin-type N-terminal cleavage/methylation domain-containing protein